MLPVKVKDFFVSRNKRILFSSGEAALVAADAAREAGIELLKQTSFVSGNVTVAAMEKALDTVHTGAKVGSSVWNGKSIGFNVFKLVGDIARHDFLCTGLCTVAIICDVTGGIYQWCPGLPHKAQVYAGTKAVSMGSIAFRDSCYKSSIKIPGC